MAVAAVRGIMHPLGEYTLVASPMSSSYWQLSLCEELSNTPPAIIVHNFTTDFTYNNITCSILYALTC